MPKTGLGEIILYGGALYIVWRILTEWNIINQTSIKSQSTCSSCSKNNSMRNLNNFKEWKPLTNEQLNKINKMTV